MRKIPQKASDVRFVFFGTPELSVIVLEELVASEFLPSLIVSRADAPVGRGKVLTAPPVAAWAKAHDIPLMQPTRITPEVIADIKARAPEGGWDLFIVAAYGKILPQALLDIPTHGTLNVHPSLLPHLRGPSPIVSTILNDERETGVSIMLLDAEMDHGPIVEQTVIDISDWPPHAHELEDTLAHAGGALLSDTIMPWLRSEIEPQEQDHAAATFCKTIEKEDGLIDLGADPYQNLLKIRALEGWPGTYTFFERNGKKIRVQIIDAHLDQEGALIIDTVRPEGKRDMPYADFIRSGAHPAH